MDDHIPVLIVGAGPTGLLMACELARQGVPFRIIDQKPERTLTANAVAIQTRTLEMLDNLGIAHQFLKLGHECKGIQLHQDGKSLARMSFEDLDSNYRFILTLPQSETERLLIEHLEELKKEVERPLELVQFEQQDSGFICKLKDPNDQIKIIQCDWLLACDGAHSKVRELCHIPFPGEDLTEQFMVANTQMSSFLSNNELHLFLNKGNMLVAVPFGSHSYRVGANLQQSPRKFLIEKEVKELIQERSHGDYDVNSVSWISPFWIHGKIVNTLRQGSIFLAGDAAHIHSPAGGQGMNTGMQDAYNLAWKLALVIKGLAKPELLESYQAERHPVVSQIVKRAERFTKLVITENPVLLSLRNLVFKLLNSHPRISRKVAMRVTQLNIRYKNSPIIYYQDSIHAQAPRPGERVPDVSIGPNQRLHLHLRTPQHKALLFTGPNPNEPAWARIKAMKQWLVQHYSKTLEVFIITAKEVPDMNPIILDDRDLIHHRFKVHAPAIYLVRPDNYLAYCSYNLDPAPLKNFLETYLT